MDLRRLLPPWITSLPGAVCVLSTPNSLLLRGAACRYGVDCDMLKRITFRLVFSYPGVAACTVYEGAVIRRL